MKRYIYTLCAMAAGLLFSCSEREMNPALDSSQQRVTIKVNVEDEPGSRAASTAPTRYMIQAYDNSGLAYGAPANVFEGGTTDRQTNATGEFEMILDRTGEYEFLLWADVNGQDVYTIGELEAGVELISGKNPVESWSSRAMVLIVTGAGVIPTLDVTLQRAVSRLTLKETGKLKINSKLVTTFNQPTGFKFSYGRLEISGSASRTETINCITAVDGTTTAVDLTEAAGVTDGKPIYVFSPNEVANVTELTFKLDAEDAFLVSNVPLRANFKTNIIGHFTSIAAKDITIKGDDTWESPDYNHPPVLPAAVGDFYYSDGSYSTALDGLKTCSGVIFEVDADNAKKVKVISLEMKPAGEVFTIVADPSEMNAAISETDGKANTDIIKALPSYIANSANYPVVAWCAAKGADWYIPAIEEYKTAHAASIEDQLALAGGAKLYEMDRNYVTSTKVTDETYMILCAVCREDNAMSTMGGYVQHITNCARAMMQVTLK